MVFLGFPFCIPLVYSLVRKKKLVFFFLGGGGGGGAPPVCIYKYNP